MRRLVIMMLRGWKPGDGTFMGCMVFGSSLIRLSFFLLAGIESRNVE